MAFQLFTVPIQDDGRALEQLNAFLRSHKVLSVDRRWVEQGATSFWSFCIDYLEGAVAVARCSHLEAVVRLMPKSWQACVTEQSRRSSTSSRSARCAGNG